MNKVTVYINWRAKDARSHFMPPQRHLCNGLTCPVDYSIFARGWTRPHGQHAGTDFGTG